MRLSKGTLGFHVDITNPGQYFACCGLLEVAHRLGCWREVEGWFADRQFRMACHDGESISIFDLIEAAIACEPLKVPIDDPKTGPIRLGDPINLQLDWWRRHDGSTNLFKTWAANATSLQMFKKWQEPLKDCLDRVKAEPESLLTVSSHVQGSYGFDSDLVWDALRVGFSFNEHSNLKKLPTRPAVELFGAIGLQRFFPNFNEQEQLVRYAVWDVPLTAPVASVAALGILPNVTIRRLRTRFVYRGSFKGLDTATIDQGESDE